MTSTVTASELPTVWTPWDDTHESMGRKIKAVGIDNFVKDFNHKYLARVEAQDNDKRAWKSDVLAFNTL